MKPLRSWTWLQRKILRTESTCWSRHRVYLRTFSSFNILELKERGFFQNIFPDTRYAEFASLLKTPQAMYCGFDPTSDSLHIGNLVSIIALIHAQRAGHLPIAVLGGATGLIGDPSGKIKDREILPVEEIENNIASLAESIQRITDNHQNFIWSGGNSLSNFRILNNAEWYRNTNVISFLSTVGRHFRLGEMISRHSVKSRLNSKEGINCTEFMYQTFQAADWLHLFQNYNCTIQIGGNDQIGNIASGFDLIHKVTGRLAFGLLVPLLLSPSGEKLGKTAGNSIWLNAEKTSPFEFYQYFLNLPDSSVESFLNLFTFCSKEEIDSLSASHQAQPEKRSGQLRIAQDITLLVHGESGLSSALKCTEVLFGSSLSALQSLTSDELSQLFKDAPTSELKFDPNMTVIELALKVGCFSRQVDAERIIKAGGFYINLERITDPLHSLSGGNYQLITGITLLRTGKKKYHLVKWLE